MKMCFRTYSTKRRRPMYNFSKRATLKNREELDKRNEEKYIKNTLIISFLKEGPLLWMSTISHMRITSTEWLSTKYIFPKRLKVCLCQSLS